MSNDSTLDLNSRWTPEDVKKVLDSIGCDCWDVSSTKNPRLVELHYSLNCQQHSMYFWFGVMTPLGPANSLSITVKDETGYPTLVKIASVLGGLVCKNEGVNSYEMFHPAKDRMVVEDFLV